MLTTMLMFLSANYGGGRREEGEGESKRKPPRYLRMWRESDQQATSEAGRLGQVSECLDSV